MTRPNGHRTERVAARGIAKRRIARQQPGRFRHFLDIVEHRNAARSMVANHSALPGNDGRGVDRARRRSSSPCRWHGRTGPPARRPGGVEDGVGADDDHGKFDRRIDSGDRGHRFVTEYCAAPGIDRHDLSAITGLTRPTMWPARRCPPRRCCKTRRTARSRGQGHSWRAVAVLAERRRGRTRWPIR